jgi:hypothetical protein
MITSVISKRPAALAVSMSEVIVASGPVGLALLCWVITALHAAVFDADANGKAMVLWFVE